MSRYDQKTGEKYGVCVTCGIDLATEDAAREHMDQTMAATESGNRRSHTVRGTNPSRASRIQSMVDEVIEEAIEEALDKLRDEIARAEVSSDEITEALRWHHDFSDEWERS